MGILDGLLGLAKTAIEQKIEESQRREFESPESVERAKKAIEFVGEMGWVGPNNRLDTGISEFNEFIKENMAMYVANAISFERFRTNIKSEIIRKGYDEGANEKDESLSKTETALMKAFEYLNKQKWLLPDCTVHTGIPRFDDFINEKLELVSEGKLNLGMFVVEVGKERNMIANGTSELTRKTESDDEESEDEDDEESEDDDEEDDEDDEESEDGDKKDFVLSPDAKINLNKVATFLDNMEWVSDDNKIDTGVQEFTNFIIKKFNLVAYGEIDFGDFVLAVTGEKKRIGFVEGYCEDDEEGEYDDDEDGEDDEEEDE
jgi:hypothetical protein